MSIDFEVNPTESRDRTIEFLHLLDFRISEKSNPSVLQCGRINGLVQGITFDIASAALIFLPGFLSRTNFRSYLTRWRTIVTFLFLFSILEINLDSFAEEICLYFEFFSQQHVFQFQLDEISFKSGLGFNLFKRDITRWNILSHNDLWIAIYVQRIRPMWYLIISNFVAVVLVNGWYKCIMGIIIYFY